MITIGINPIAFTIGAISVRWYGIMIALAIIVLIYWIIREARKEARLSYEMVVIIAVVGIPSGIIISRLLHVLDQWEYFFQNPGQIIGGSGLTIYGAVLGASLGAWILSKFKSYPFGHMVDLAAPGIILAQAIGRVGCTINGCCYGIESNLPWAVIYTHPESFGPLNIPVHPTQIYEVIFNLIVFAVLLKLRGRLRPDGSLFLIYLSLYSLWRLGVGFLREGTPLLFGLHEAQLIGIVVLLIAIPSLVLRTRWVRVED
jgi:phosphatidylglycerol:prolipoprotein diacylglycerol transferase